MNWMHNDLSDIVDRFKREGTLNTLAEMFNTVEEQIDATLLIDNPDIPIITNGLLSITSISGMRFAHDLTALGEFADEVRLIQRILLGAYCMGYKRGRGKGLTLVVREENDAKV